MTMKTRNLLFALLAIAFFIGSCNQVDDLTDITFNTEFTADLNCEVVPGTLKSGINGTFSASATIDPLADSTVEKYIDKIKSWEITNLKGEILSVSKEGANLLSAQIGVSNANHSATWQIGSTPLVVGQEIVLDNANGQWDSVNQILAEKQIFTVVATGTTDEDDMSFVIRLTINSKVTANPL